MYQHTQDDDAATELGKSTGIRGGLTDKSEPGWIGVVGFQYNDGPWIDGKDVLYSKNDFLMINTNIGRFGITCPATATTPWLKSESGRAWP